MEPNDNDILDTSRLCFDGDFNAQVLHILQYVRLSRREVENLQCLLDDLQIIFQMRWPGCEVHPFGSIVTGLGIKTSDVDCFVLLPNEQDATNDTVFIARNLLRQYRMFGELFAIANARVPIVKFLHYPTNCYCDVNFNSPSGVRNSKLISYYLSLDRKALELTVLIKYWSKVHKFTGTNLVSNYTLILMVIFYLQQKNNFPTVYELQKDARTYFVNNWNTAFETPAQMINITESLYDMMGGFFKYYSNFNFSEQVVSPFLGRAVNKATFKSLDIVPDEFSLYKYNVFNKVCQTFKINTIMCIQDPFEHNRNCSGAVYSKLVEKVLLYFSFAAKRHEEEEKEFLKSILTGVPVNNAGSSETPKQCSPAERKRRAALKRNILNNTIGKHNKKGKYSVGMLYQEMRRVKKQQHNGH